jgi:hypothetical protein
VDGRNVHLHGLIEINDVQRLSKRRAKYFASSYITASVVRVSRHSPNKSYFLSWFKQDMLMVFSLWENRFSEPAMTASENM